jgi:peptide/nickel transport system permease protein
MTNIDSADIASTDTLFPVTASQAGVPAPSSVTPSLRKRLHIPKPSVIFASVWLIGLTALTFLATFAPGAVPFIRDYDAKVKVNGHAKAYGFGPGWNAWFGTGKSSEDIFARCIYGAKMTLIIGIGATLFGLIIGSIIGVVSGYFRGWTDRIGSILTDCLLSIPPLLLALILILRLDDLKSVYTWMSWITRPWQITFTLGLVAVAPFARIVRAQTLTLREREFVTAARSLGASRSRIIFRELFPNLIPAMVTVAFTGLGILIAAEAGLAFLGLGVERPATWGKMIDIARDDIERAWWATVFPCIMLFLTVLSFNLLGDELARRFDIREAAV